MLTSDFSLFLMKRFDEFKTKGKPDRVKMYSGVVEDTAHKISLKMMPVVLITVFLSVVDECQVQKPCIHDELRFISFTKCLYSEV